MEYVESIFNDIVQKLSSVDLPELLEKEASEGKSRAVVWTYKGFHYGWKTILHKENVEYETKPMPIAFLVKGPLKDDKRKLYGLKYFTSNGVETLQQKLMIKFTPFKVYVNLSAADEMEVVLSWRDSPPVPSSPTKEDDFEVEL